MRSWEVTGFSGETSCGKDSATQCSSLEAIPNCLIKLVLSSQPIKGFKKQPPPSTELQYHQQHREHFLPEIGQLSISVALLVARSMGAMIYLFVGSLKEFLILKH